MNDISRFLRFGVFSFFVLLFSIRAPAQDTSGVADFASWQLETHQGAIAHQDAGTDGPGGAASETITVDSNGDGNVTWYVQFSHPLALEKGKSYHFSVMAKVATPCSICVAFAQFHDPWKMLGTPTVSQLDPNWVEVSCDLVADVDDPEARIMIGNLNVPGMKLSLSQPKLEVK